MARLDQVGTGRYNAGTVRRTINPSNTMSEQYFYTTQTTLAHRIQITYYGRLYVYIAEEFNAAANDPTSNPCRIAEEWCVVAGASRADHLLRWVLHKRKLREVATAKNIKGEISDETLGDILSRIAHTTPAEAAPLVYHIPRAAIDLGRLQVGDPRPEYPANIEHRLFDLRREEIDQIEEVDCHALACE